MTDENPIRPRKVFETPFAAVEPKFNGYDKTFGIVIHGKHAPDPRVDIARDLIARWGLVAANADGEDSAGRAKLRLATPEELVARACDAAEKAYAEFEARGWLVPLPAVDELYEAARENSDRN